MAAIGIIFGLVVIWWFWYEGHKIHIQRQLTEDRQRDQERLIQQQALKENFMQSPVVNTHRIPCPVCNTWSTLMVNSQADQLCECPQCGSIIL